MVFPWWLSGKESACNCRRPRFDPWVRKILWRRKWQPTPGFFPGKTHGQRSLVGCSLSSVQFSHSVCPTLCDPMNRSTPGLPIHHQLPEFTHTHVHRVSDAIQPSHPPSSPFPPAPNPSSIRVFSNESALHMRWPKYWSFSLSIIPSKEHPGLISLQSKGLSRVFSNTTVQKHLFFSAQLSLLSNRSEEAHV